MQRITPELTANARDLRTNATEAERTLWRSLRLIRPRFTRQLVVDRYILDFACRSLKLAVELDGSQHLGAAESDEARTAYLTGRGWRVMRFWNSEVLGNADGVATAVLAEMERLSSTHPRPLP